MKLDCVVAHTILEYQSVRPKSFIVQLHYATGMHINKHYPLTNGKIKQVVGEWGKSNCSGKWRLGGVENVYFDEYDEALLFYLTHCG